jgi:hypothetical protein
MPSTPRNEILEIWSSAVSGGAFPYQLQAMIICLQAKEKASSLLDKLIKKINIIEHNHTFQINRSVDPKQIRDDIEDLVKIRVELAKLIQDSKN